MIHGNHRQRLLWLLAVLLLPAAPWSTGAQEMTPAQKKVLDNLFQTAQTYQQIGRHEQALELFRQLQQHQPQDSRYRSGIEDNLLALKRYDELVAMLNQQLQSGPDVNALGKLGDAYFQWGKRAEADSAWRRLIEMAPDSRIPYIIVHNYLFKHRQIDAAIELLSEGRMRLGDESQFEFEMARLFSWNGDMENGTREYLKILRRNPQTYNTVERELMEFSADSQRVALVAATVDAARQDTVQQAALTQLLANLYIRNRNYAGAYDTYRDLDRLSGAGGTQLLHFATVAARDGAYEQAATAFREILQSVRHPDLRIQARLGQGRMLELWGLEKKDSGLLQEAIQAYRQVKEDGAAAAFQAEAFYRIGEILLNWYFDLDAAADAYTFAAGLDPKIQAGWRAQVRLGDCALARGDLQGARTRYQAAATIPYDPAASIREEAQLKTAQTYFLEGQPMQAMEQVSLLLGSLQPASDLYNDLLTFQLVLRAAADANAPLVQSFITASRLEVQRKYSEAAAVLRNGLASGGRHSLEPDAQYLLAELDLRAGNAGSAVKIWDDLIARFPGHYQAEAALLQAARVYEEQLHNPQKAAAAYERILTDYPNSLYVEEARQRLRKLESERLP